MEFGMVMNVHHLNIKPYRALDNCAQGSHDFTKGIRHNGKTDGLALLLDRERLNFTQGQIQKPQRFQKALLPRHVYTTRTVHHRFQLSNLRNSTIASRPASSWINPLSGLAKSIVV